MSIIHFSTDRLLDGIVRMIRMAGYAPGCSLASASLPVNLAIEAKVQLTAKEKRQLKAWQTNPNLYGSQGFYHP
jgi:uncharacterized protein with PIN domain